jgi:hypothetical protein
MNCEFLLRNPLLSSRGREHESFTLFRPGGLATKAVRRTQRISEPYSAIAAILTGSYAVTDVSPRRTMWTARPRTG